MLRVIDPNRWFLWAITFSVAVGLLLILSIQKLAEEYEEQAINAYESTVWKTFASKTLGISVRYPPFWQIEIDPLDVHAVYFENSRDYNENISVSVREPRLEPVIRSALRISSEKSVTLDGQSGRWIVGRDASDPATGNVVLIRRGENLYIITGSAKTFERIIKGIKFINI